jgi:hypothetical protein
MSCATCACAAIQEQQQRHQIGRTVNFTAAEDYQPPRPQVQTQLAPIDDMLAAIAYEGDPLPEALLKIDQASNGEISRILSKRGFTGAFGQRVLMELSGSVTSPRYIYLVGVGPAQPLEAGRTASVAAEKNRVNLCAVFGAFSQTAANLGVHRLIVAFHGYSGQHFDIVGATALLRCRCQVEAKLAGAPLAELVVVVSPQDKVLVDAGLKACMPLCGVCSRPQIDNR